MAGTSFHELWALSQAMKLLDTRTAVTAVSVEGVGPASKLVQQSTDYDGVDLHRALHAHLTAFQKVQGKRKQMLLSILQPNEIERRSRRGDLKTLGSELKKKA